MANDPYAAHIRARKILPFLGVLFAACFVLIMCLVKYSPTSIIGLDTYVHELLLPLQTPAWSRALLVFTNFGSVGGIIAGLLVVTYVYRHRPDVLTRLWIALLGVAISGTYIKEWVHRMRPPVLPWLQPIADSFSFPSGHSDGSIVFYGFLALLLYVHSPTQLRRFFSLAVPALLVLLIGLSRLALNYHYVTDVLGGYLLGAFWLTFSLSVPLFYAFYHRGPEDVIHTEPIIRPML